MSSSNKFFGVSVWFVFKVGVKVKWLFIKCIVFIRNVVFVRFNIIRLICMCRFFNCYCYFFCKFFDDCEKFLGFCVEKCELMI